MNKNIKIFLNYFLGPLLFTWLSFSIYDQIKHQPDLMISWVKIKRSMQSREIWQLAAVVFLMLINWSIEAVKWKMAVQHIQPIGFWRAFRAVLSGVSFSVSTPNRMGEYLGRVLYMEEGNRLRVISLTIVCSMSQLIITLLAGFTGLFFIHQKIETAGMQQGFDASLWLQGLQYGVLIVCIILTLIYFRLSLITGWIDKLRKGSRYTWLVNALKNIDAALLLKLLSLSAIRFLVFIVQYFLLFRLFGISMGWWQSFWAMGVIFLVLAIIPTFAIAELGLRGKVSLQILGLFSSNSLGIGLTAAVVWFVNLVMPAIAGSLLIVSIKIFKNKNERT